MSKKIMLEIAKIKMDMYELKDQNAELRAENQRLKKYSNNIELENLFSTLRKTASEQAEQIQRLKEEMENVRKLATLKDYIGCLVVAERALAAQPQGGSDV